MKKLSLKLNIDGLDLIDKDKDKEPAELFMDIIHVICKGYAFISGLDEKERYQYHKLCDVIDEAIKGGSEEVVLDNEYARFLLKAKKEGKFIPNKLTRRVEDLIQDMEKIDEIKE